MIIIQDEKCLLLFSYGGGAPGINLTPVFVRKTGNSFIQT